jgi:hypothetical protein
MSVIAVEVVLLQFATILAVAAAQWINIGKWLRRKKQFPFLLKNKKSVNGGFFGLVLNFMVL